MKLNDKVIILPNKEYSQEVYSGMTGVIYRIINKNIGVVYEIDLDESSKKKIHKINACNREHYWTDRPGIYHYNLRLFNGGVINTE